MEQGKTQRLRLYQDENTGVMWLVVMNSEVPCGLPDAFFSERIGDFALVRQGESLLVGRISAPSQNILGRVLSRMAVFMKRTLTTSTAQPPRLTPCLCDAVPAPTHESVSGLHGLAHPLSVSVGWRSAVQQYKPVSTLLPDLDTALSPNNIRSTVAVETVVTHCPRTDPYERNYRIRLLP